MTDTASEQFSFGGCDFTCSAFPIDAATFQPRVWLRRGNDGKESVELPADSDAYGTAAEALRHAEQQAIRWVHQSKDGQGRY